jgi:uncharacterized RDD family membrane protein YckC
VADKLYSSSDTTSERSAKQKPAGILRRLCALFYDTLLVIAVIFIAFQPLPLIDELVKVFPFIQILKSLYLLIVWFLSLGWFWTHGGQTVGMKAWRMKLLRENGERLAWPHAMIRFSVSNGFFLLILLLIGNDLISTKFALMIAVVAISVGFLWMVFDKQGRAWHDILSRTQLVILNSHQR